MEKGQIGEDEISQCDFLDVLEEAAIGKLRLRMELEGGRELIGRVEDVVTQGGKDYVVLIGDGDRIPVAAIRRLSRGAEEPEPRQNRPPLLH